MVGLNGRALPDADVNQLDFNGSRAIPVAKDGQQRRARTAHIARGPKPLLPRSLKEALQLAELLSKSKLFPKGFETPETCLVGILYGMELGLSPIAALQRMAVIDGRPTIWGDAALALVQSSGLLQSIEEEIIEKEDSDNRKILTAICKVNREGRSEPTTGTFSNEDAKRAGLWQKPGPWTDYPKRMLTMRARAFALRDAFPDVLAGLYIREEFEATEKKQSRSPQDHSIRDEADWNAIGAQHSPSSYGSRRAPPPPPDSNQDRKKGAENDKEAISLIEQKTEPDDPQSPIEVSGIDEDKRGAEIHLDPETLLDLFDSALCCALDLPTLEEIVDDFAERLNCLSKDDQKRAQKIINRHRSRVDVLDRTDLRSDEVLNRNGDLSSGHKSLLPNLGLGRRRSMRRRERIGARLSLSRAEWKAQRPPINPQIDQSDEETTSSYEQEPEAGE